MGQRDEVWGVGPGTVRIGRPEIEEMGGGFLTACWVSVGEDGGEGIVEGCCEVGPERETVFVGRSGRRFSFVEVAYEGVFLTGMPDTIGGGRSSPSAAFRDNCLAKSEACHHSRNLSAKIDVGRRRRRLESKRGYMSEVKVIGFQMLLVWPGRAPDWEGGTGGICSARAMAR